MTKLKKVFFKNMPATAAPLPKPATTAPPPKEPLIECEPDARFNSTEWYSEYAARVRAVRPPSPYYGSKNNDFCHRWWHTNQQPSYHVLPLRVWSGVLKPEHLRVPPCTFGQAALPKHRCNSEFRALFRALDSLRVVYYARSGTELGIVRGGGLLGSDGDLDFYVDMPSKLLHDKLQGALSPKVFLSGTGESQEVHWNAPGCPVVHMVYNDWIAFNELAQPSDLCTCLINSINLTCHRDGQNRMYTQYGPSWLVPLGLKQMDMPYWASTNKKHHWVKKMRSKLKSMVEPTTGHIEAEVVRALLTDNIPVDSKDMSLILAQLNVIGKSIGAF